VLLAGLLQFTRRVVDHIAAVVHRRENGFAVDKHLDRRLFTAIEPEVDFVEARRHRKHHRFIFVPQKVLGASINGLHLPWNGKSILELSTLPEPASRAVLGAESLVDRILFIESGTQLLLGNNTGVDLLVDLVQGLVDFLGVSFEVKKGADVLDVRLPGDLLDQVCQLLLHRLVEVEELILVQLQSNLFSDRFGQLLHALELAAADESVGGLVTIHFLIDHHFEVGVISLPL